MAAREWWEYSDPAIALARKEAASQAAGVEQVVDPFGRLTAVRRRHTAPKKKEIDFRLRVSPALHERLERWGELMRERRKPDISMTGKVCHHLAVMAGKHRERYVAPTSPADVADAAVVEAAWRGSLLPMKDKVMLAGYYCYGVHPAALCRTAAIPYREFDALMFHAVTSIGNILDVREKRRHNSSTT